jgi:hypothetical protein
LRKVPELYNPLPEIFATRGRHKLLPVFTWPGTYLKNAFEFPENENKDIYFLVLNGSLKKVLFHVTKIGELEKINENFLEHEISTKEQIKCERGWRYINCSIPLKVGLPDDVYSLFPFLDTPKLEINKRYYATTPEIFSNGWDLGFVYWSRQGKSVFSLKLHSKTPSSIRMTIYGTPIKNQRIIIRLKDSILFDGIYDREDALSFFIPASLLNFGSGLNIFSFHCITEDLRTMKTWYEFACSGILLETVEKSMPDRQADASFRTP